MLLDLDTYQSLWFIQVLRIPFLLPLLPGPPCIILATFGPLTWRPLPSIAIGQIRPEPWLKMSAVANRDRSRRGSRIKDKGVKILIFDSDLVMDQMHFELIENYGLLIDVRIHIQFLATSYFTPRWFRLFPDVPIMFQPKCHQKKWGLGVSVPGPFKLDHLQPD